MQRTCRKRETTGLKGNIKRGAADVRLNTESQIQKALWRNVKRGLQREAGTKDLVSMGGCREIRKSRVRIFDYGGRSRKTRLITALK